MIHWFFFFAYKKSMAIQSFCLLSYVVLCSDFFCKIEFFFSMICLQRDKNSAAVLQRELFAPDLPDVAEWVSSFIEHSWQSRNVCCGYQRWEVGCYLACGRPAQTSQKETRGPLWAGIVIYLHLSSLLWFSFVEYCFFQFVYDNIIVFFVLLYVCM